MQLVTVMQCPLGHPPGPQPFCPICGRQAVPVTPLAAGEPAAPEVPGREESATSWEPLRDGLEPAPAAPADAPTTVHDLGGAQVHDLGGPPAAAELPGPPPSALSFPAPPPPAPPSAPPPPVDLAPAAPPFPFAPAPPVGAPAPEPVVRSDDAPGGAAAKARELIAELSAPPASPGPTHGIPGQPSAGVPIPPAPPGSPATLYVSPGSPVPSFGNDTVPSFGNDTVPSFGNDTVPSFGNDPVAPAPSYTPQERAGLGFAPLDPTPSVAGAGPASEEPAPSGQWSTAAEPPPLPRNRRSRIAGSSGGSPIDGRATDEPGDGPRTRRLPILLLIAALLLGGAYLVKTQLLDSTGDTTSTAPPARASSAPRASASPALAGTTSAADLAASLQNPHFKHGYDAGKRKGTVAPADRESTCRTMALAERSAGYPWGAHDRAGCLVALAGS
ncbi:MAG: hypothetical protein NVS3B26_09980 [Mycobacteriales bacterium]